MTVHIAVLGLNRVGISTALALHTKSADIHCLGWDVDPDRREAAKDSGAFLKIVKKVKNAVTGADLIILTLAPEDMKSALCECKENIKPNVVLVNMSNLQALPAQLTKDILAWDARFVSLLPVLNPAFLQESPEVLGNGRADLFTGSQAYISAPPTTGADVLDTAVDLAVLLGSLLIFAGAVEVDGLIAANALLPEMAAFALMDTVSGQPSWRDGKAIAAEGLAQASAPLADERVPAAVQDMRANCDNAVRLLDDLTASLQRLKAALLDEDAASLEAFLGDAWKAREDWLKERRQAGANKAAFSSVPTEKYALERFLKLGS